MLPTDNDTQRIYLVSEERLNLMKEIVEMLDSLLEYGDGEWNYMHSPLKEKLTKLKELNNARAQVGDIRTTGDTRSASDSTANPRLDNDKEVQ